MITLPKKQSLENDWLEIKDIKGKPTGEKLKIDYPTREQQRILNYKQANIISDSVNRGEKSLIYFETLLKFTVKDWGGLVEDSEGKEIKCTTENDQLSEDSFDIITYDLNKVFIIADQIKECLGFDELDKKK